MSESGEMMLCRECHERISTEVDNCPHCGRDTLGWGPYAGLVVGLVIALASTRELGNLWFFGLIGLVIAIVGGWMLWDKRQRISRASEGVEDAAAESAS